MDLDSLPNRNHDSTRKSTFINQVVIIESAWKIISDVLFD